MVTLNLNWPLTVTDKFQIVYLYTNVKWMWFLPGFKSKDKLKKRFGFPVLSSKVLQAIDILRLRIISFFKHISNTFLFDGNSVLEKMTWQITTHHHHRHHCHHGIEHTVLPRDSEKRNFHFFPIFFLHYFHSTLFVGFNLMIF